MVKVAVDMKNNTTVCVGVALSVGTVQYMLVFFIILRNSVSLTSPSPSLSASSIIS